MLSILEKLNQTERVSAVGMKAKKCKNDTIKGKMKEKEVLYAGTSGKLDYKKLVKAQSDLAIVSSAFCQKKEAAKKQSKRK